MFTKTGIEGLKRIVADLSGTTASNDMSASLDKGMGINQPKVTTDPKKEVSGGFDGIVVNG